MLKRLYQVYDLKAEATLGPILLENRDGPAIRTFSAVLQDKNTIIGQHPADYELRYLGDINDQGVIAAPSGVPQVVMTGAAWAELHNSASRQGRSESKQTDLTLGEHNG